MVSLWRGVSKFINAYIGEALARVVANFINGFFVKRVSDFVNGYIGDVLVKCLPILSIISLLRGISKCINGYMDESLVIGFPNFLNGFFLESGLKNM